MASGRPHKLGITRPVRFRFLFGVAAALGASALVSFACSSFEAEDQVVTVDGSVVDAGVDSSTSSADVVTDSGPLTDAAIGDGGSCPTKPCLKSNPQCDLFDRATPFVGWTTSGATDQVTIEDGGCSGGVLHVAMPALPLNSPTSTKFLQRAVTGALTSVEAELDLFLTVDVTKYVTGGISTVFSISSPGAASTGGRLIAINVDKSSNVAFVIRQGSGASNGTDFTQTLPIVPNQWTHVKMFVKFAKSLMGQLTVWLDGQKTIDLANPTLAPEANDGTGFNILLGIQSRVQAPPVEARYDNFVATFNQ